MDLRTERVRPSGSCTTTKRGPLPDLVETTGSVRPKRAWLLAQTLTSDTTRSSLEASALLGNSTIADAVLDRLVHNASLIELSGESLRKRRSS